MTKVDNHQQASSHGRQLSAVYISMFYAGLIATLLGTLLPLLIAEFGLSYSVSGLVIGASYAGALTAASTSGLIPRRIGNRRTLILYVAAPVLGLLLLPVARLPILLMLGFGLVGFGRNGTSAMTNMVVTLISERPTGPLNRCHSLYAVGALLGPLLVAFCLGRLGLGWQSVVAVELGIGLLVLPAVAPVRLTDSDRSTRRDKTYRFLRNPDYWVSVGAMFFYVCTEYSLMGWLVTYFAQSGLITLTHAQTLTSALWLAIWIGRMVCGCLAGRVGKFTLLLVMGLGSVAFFAVMMIIQSPMAITLSVMGLGLFMGGIYPTGISTISQIVLEEPNAMALMVTVTASGGFLTSCAIGFVAETFGLKSGMMVPGASVALLLVFIVAGWARSGGGHREKS